MGDFQGPIILSPPPSSSSSDKSSTTMLYYGLVVVGIAAMALALYNFIIIKRSRRQQMMQSEAEGPNGLVIESSITENCQSQRNNSNMVSRFKYKKKEAGKEGVVGDDNECSICLCCFEEGEEVRKLPRCKHLFHAPCIDMWLYSHFDCPNCRTYVNVVGSFFCERLTQENSGPGLRESGGGDGVLVLV